MPARERPPDRRSNTTCLIVHEGMSYSLTDGRFTDGRLAEIFLSNHKNGSAADTNARDAAIVLSIALQYGADVETIRRALCRDSKGRASGVLGAALDHLAAGQR